MICRIRRTFRKGERGGTGEVPKSPSNGLESQGKETEWERRRDEEGDRASATHIQLADRQTDSWQFRLEEEKGAV